MNFLNMMDFTHNQIMQLFHIADQLKGQKIGRILEGKTFVLFFPESSIRTRITFERGIKDLGGECILFPPESLNKQEELSDVMRYLNNWVDGVIIRHPDFNKIVELSKQALVPIINAMSSENHPCEVLTDMYSIRELRPNFQKLTYTFVGPAANMVRTWVEIARVLNLKLQHVCTEGNRICADGDNYRFSTDLDQALMGSDVVLTDSLPREYQTQEYIEKYQINLERMGRTRQDSLLNPCPPFYRNQEVSEDALDSPYFVGYSFKRNLLYVQQAIIVYCLGMIGEGAPLR